jgi:hypothetical protein
VRAGHKGLTLRKRRSQPLPVTRSKLRREQKMASMLDKLVTTRPEFFKN